MHSLTHNEGKQIRGGSYAPQACSLLRKMENQRGEDNEPWMLYEDMEGNLSLRFWGMVARDGFVGGSKDKADKAKIKRGENVPGRG